MENWLEEIININIFVCEIKFFVKEWGICPIFNQSKQYKDRLMDYPVY